MKTLRQTLKRGVRAMAFVGAVAVGAFHVRLLVGRLTEGSILQPVVAAQWLGALLLLVAFAHSLRSKVSITGGRRALALWLLVLVLHGLSGSPQLPPALADAAIIDPLVLALPGLLVISLIATLAVTRPRARGATDPRVRWLRLAQPCRDRARGGSLRLIAPRGPPA